MALSSWRRYTTWALLALGQLVGGAAGASSPQGGAIFLARLARPADAVCEAALVDGSGAVGPRQVRLVSVGGEGGPGGAAAGAIGPLPASYEGELPGAGNPIVWHLDLLPEGRYRLRLTYVGRPEPNRFDDIGRWTRERDTGRIVLRGGREAPVFLLPVEGGAALRKLDLHGRPIESAHNDRLARLPEPALIEPRLWLTGMFAYLADAARISLCVDGSRLPVATEGDYLALERAYLAARQQPGEPLLVSLEGLITRRPSMEEGRPPETTLVVERFIAIWPGAGCGTTPGGGHLERPDAAAGAVRDRLETVAPE